MSHNEINAAAPAFAPIHYRDIVERMCHIARGLIDTETPTQTERRRGRRGTIAEDALAELQRRLDGSDVVERTPELAELVDDLATVCLDEDPMPPYYFCQVEEPAGMIPIPSFSLVEETGIEVRNRSPRL